MKNFLTLLLCFTVTALFVPALSSCNTPKQPEYTFNEYSIQEQVIVDENGIKITVLGAAADEYGNPGIKLRAESSNPQKTEVYIYGDGINGISYSTTFSSLKQGTVSLHASLNTGESFEDIIAFDKQTFSEIGMESIKSFELSIQALFLGEYDELGGGYEVLGDVFDVKFASVHTSLFDDKEQKLDVNGIALYDENGVRFTVKKGSNKTVYGVDDIVFCLENISNEKNVNASVTAFEVVNTDNEWSRLFTNDAELDEFELNGVEPVEILYHSVFESNGVSAGKAAVSPALWIEDTLLDNGFKSIDKIRFCFTLSFSDPQSKETDTLPAYPVLDSTTYTVPYGEYIQTVEIDFSKQSAKTLLKYDPSNIPSEQYTIDGGNGETGEAVIFEEHDLRITVLSRTSDKQGIRLRIENYSDKPLNIFFADTVSNGIDIDNEYWMYMSNMYSMWGLNELPYITPGSYIETTYTPSFNLVQSNNGEENTSFLYPEYVIDELQTLSFRIVIEDASSQTAYSNVLAARYIDLTVDENN